MKCAKRMLPLLLLALALLLSACNSADGENSYQEPEENVLVYAALNPVSHSLERSIKQFNDAHTDIQIKVRDYSDEGGPQRLLVELVAGHIPDIMELQKTAYIDDGHGTFEALWWGSIMRADYSFHSTWEFSGENYWMPYRRLVQMGYFEDLWPYIENDPDLGREGILETPLKAAEVDGGLYMLFKEFSVDTLMGPKSIVGDRHGWTLDELMETFSSMPEGSTILRYDAVQSDVFFSLLSNTLDQFIDWGTGQCSFDSEEFRDMLVFLSNFPAEFETNLSEEQLDEEVALRALKGLQMLEPRSIGVSYDMPGNTAVFAEPVAYVGYPTADGSCGSYFIPQGNKLAMSALCQNKEAAWEFMRILIRRSGRGVPGMEEAQRMAEIRIPVNRRDYNMMNRATLTVESWFPHSAYPNGPKVKVDPFGEGDIQQLDALINATTRIYWPDSNLADIVWESIGPYLVGDKSLDDTVALVQGRVSLYVNEQR